MKILAIRTDKPEAEIGLFEDSKRLKYLKWSADRQLAETLNAKIDALLADAQLPEAALEAIIIYKGPGSFTGLRIGFSAANALAYGLGLPIVSTGGEDWVTDGIAKLGKKQADKFATPDYGGEAHVTAPKK